MKYPAFKTRALRTFRPAIALEHAYPKFARRRTVAVLDIVLTFSILGAVATLIAEHTDLANAVPAARALAPFSGIFYGTTLILLTVRIVFMLMDALFYSYYFEGLDTMLHEHGRDEGTHMSFEVADLLYRTHDKDLTGGFVASPVGRKILARCGLFEEEVDSFMASERTRISSSSLEAEFQEDVTISDYAAILFSADENFARFLFKHELQESDFVGAARWVEQKRYKEAQHKRFWSRDNLGRIPGVGKGWSYGQTYYLDKYSRDIKDLAAYSTAAQDSSVGEDELELLETTLVRAHDTNALLVGEEGTGKLEVVARLARRIKTGEALPPIEHKRVYVFDGDGLIANTKEKGIFEEEFRKTLNQSVSAGNIILVIEHLPAFIASARAIGTDIVALLEPFLASNSLQIIATSNEGNFHEVIEPDTRLMRRFEAISVGETDAASTLKVLESAAQKTEAKEPVFFTFPALVAIQESAKRYFPTGVMPDKAVDLLAEVAPAVIQRGQRIIDKERVLDLVQAKTGVPLGEVQEDEREKLLNLETLLHERIIGQDAAVQAIAQAMQRSRSGLRSSERPMGAFLFLGPTGVGKTETAKTLADVFFGDKDNMMRLNMSEYSAEDALSRLIGSFETGKQGALVSMLRQQQYGVFLLDEFEKTNSEVLDLFLQIFDEGEFADAHGKEVNARDVIFIATSNAGSDLIWNYFQQGEDVSENKTDLINTIIERGIFKPELLNRFDGTIVFHPLSEEHIRRIAELMLAEVQERLKKQGIELVINTSLVSFLVEEGYDPEFGARPMGRAISEHIEQAIAEKKLRGEIQAGDSIELTGEDLRQSGT